MSIQEKYSCVYPEETWRFDAKISHNPSEFCWLDLKRCRHEGDPSLECMFGPPKKFAKPSTLKSCDFVLHMVSLSGI